MKKVIELLPCPFCGGEAVSGISNYEPEEIVIECRDCNCSTPSCEKGSLAISFWNTRLNYGNNLLKEKEIEHEAL